MSHALVALESCQRFLALAEPLLRDLREHEGYSDPYMENQIAMMTKAVALLEKDLVLNGLTPPPMKPAPPWTDPDQVGAAIGVALRAAHRDWNAYTKAPRVRPVWPAPIAEIDGWRLGPLRYPNSIGPGEVVVLREDGREALAVFATTLGQELIVYPFWKGPARHARPVYPDTWATSGPVGAYQGNEALRVSFRSVYAVVGKADPRTVDMLPEPNYARFYSRPARSGTFWPQERAEVEMKPGEDSGAYLKRLDKLIERGGISQPEPGDVLWAEVPWAEGGGSKDRPVLVVRSWAGWVSVVKLTSKAHSNLTTQVAVDTSAFSSTADSYADVSRTIPLRTELLRTYGGQLSATDFANVMAVAPKVDE